MWLLEKTQTEDVEKIKKKMHNKSEEKIYILKIPTDKKDEENIVPNFAIGELEMIHSKDMWKSAEEPQQTLRRSLQIHSLVVKGIEGNISQSREREAKMAPKIIFFVIWP